MTNIFINTQIFDGDNNIYTVKESIRNGGFGQVFKIERNDNKQVYALKVPNTAPFVSDVDLRSFLNEYQNAIQVNHTNVIKYYYLNDGSTFKDLPVYMIMEYADGGTLEDFIANSKQSGSLLEAPLILNMYDHLISAMKAINSFVVHRDIKPANILRCGEVWKVTDFGLAKLYDATTRSLSFKGYGSMDYAAPECWRGDKNTMQMDIYSMGIVFYEIAFLHHPYSVQNDSQDEWRKTHLFLPPKNPMMYNPTIEPSTCIAVMKMMEKDKNKRPQNWDEVKEHINSGVAKVEDDDIISSLLIRTLERNDNINKENAEKDRRTEEIKQFQDNVNYQFQNDIFNPIKEFIESVNFKRPDDVISINQVSNKLSINYSRKSVYLDYRYIIEEDFYRYVPENDFGRNIQRKILDLPTYRGSRIKAWGFLKASDRRGFNIILVDQPDNDYGYFVMLFNTHHQMGGHRDNHPDPFPFEFNELEKEIKLITAMHIYHTQQILLDLKTIKEFVSGYLT